MIRLGESRVKVYDPRVADGIRGDKNRVLSISIENTLCGIVLILLISLAIFSSFAFLLYIYALPNN